MRLWSWEQNSCPYDALIPILCWVFEPIYSSAWQTVNEKKLNRRDPVKRAVSFLETIKVSCYQFLFSKQTN